MKVYELHKALQYNGEWHPTGGSWGKLYATLERAQAQVVGAGPWRKRDRRRQWETDHKDIRHRAEGDCVKLSLLLLGCFALGIGVWRLVARLRMDAQVSRLDALRALLKDEEAA